MSKLEQIAQSAARKVAEKYGGSVELSKLIRCGADKGEIEKGDTTIGYKISGYQSLWRGWTWTVQCWDKESGKTEITERYKKRKDAFDNCIKQLQTTN